MRSVFVGTGGFLGRIDGETRCAFWADEPTDHGFDPRRLITVDLDRTPSDAAAGEFAWSEVEVDDCFTGRRARLQPGVRAGSGRGVCAGLGGAWPSSTVIRVRPDRSVSHETARKM